MGNEEWKWLKDSWLELKDEGMAKSTGLLNKNEVFKLSALV